MARQALPPIEPILPVIAYWRQTSDADLAELMRTLPDSAAVLRFAVSGVYLIPHIIDSRRGGPWQVLGHQIPELNKHLGGEIVVVARRDPKPD
jgi:hypothetical protein